ncbi:MAG TPA: membrane protein insertase YidC, partial [Acidimicrobiales bacterium]|nr:membrane protein insertase YidC [Acidimicrobiales bacterium]
MMKFYKENHVNPFGSCLPLLIQAPILIVLYRLIIGLTGSVIVGFTIAVVVTTGPLAGVSIHGGHIKGGTVSDQGIVTKGTLEGATATVADRPVGSVTGAEIVNGKIPTAQVVNATGSAEKLTDLTVQGGEVRGDPKHVPKDSKLERALVKSGGEMDSFGMDLSKAASKVTDSSAIPYFILILGVVATGYYQQRQLTARTPKTGAANTQMQMIGKIFPVMFGVISYTIPAGVVVYFLVSNIWQIGQQAFIFRNQELPPPTTNGKSSTSAKSSGAGAGGAKAKDKTKPGAKATPKGRAGAPAARTDGKGARRSNRPNRGSTAKNQQRSAADRRRASQKSIPPKKTPRKDDT